MSVFNQSVNRTLQARWAVNFLAKEVVFVDAKRAVFDSRLHFGVVQYVVGDGAILDSMLDWAAHSGSNVSKDLVFDNLGLRQTDCA